MEVASLSKPDGFGCPKCENNDSSSIEVLHQFLRLQFGEIFEKFVRETEIECKCCKRKIKAEELLPLNGVSNQMPSSDHANVSVYSFSSPALSEENKLASPDCAAYSAAKLTSTSVEVSCKPDFVETKGNQQSLGNGSENDVMGESDLSQVDSNDDIESVEDEEVVVSADISSQPLQHFVPYRKPCKFCKKMLGKHYVSTHEAFHCKENPSGTNANKTARNEQERMNVGEELVGEKHLNNSNLSALQTVDSVHREKYTDGINVSKEIQVKSPETANDNESVFGQSGSRDKNRFEEIWNKLMPVTGEENDVRNAEDLFSFSNTTLETIPKPTLETPNKLSLSTELENSEGTEI